ncbi:MAG TPA: D-alanyl-D-alanine carboxypeptidase/D-alanyl-D-alanine-endopeptidase [candidate division WOR-3 bacterium]|uniref:D-alanyl-D-alanine carboxypeptidase/D-alanyl-D-alanine-endopeptidase n=1 Tax=candidate division WOR-3 bacterium TaxID=2052148 RepID=A0A7C5E755_UNCW3|nr:D-alanyl-D-alanine carboxypeptidase/D-alanyl-D-alanine-endopeptidase [candidate division WOR-3 bacterium]
MRKFIVLLLLVMGCATLRPGRAKIERQLLDLIKNKAPEGTFLGVSVVDINGREIFSYNVDKFFVPASCNKLITASASLYWLGPDYRFKTVLLSDSCKNLYMIASGDPSMTVGDLSELLDRLKVRGDSVWNSIFLVDIAYDTISQGTGWMWDDRPYYYQAPVSSFILNKNMLTADFYYEDSIWKLDIFPPSKLLRIKIKKLEDTLLHQKTYFKGDTTIIELWGKIDTTSTYHFLRSIKNPRVFFKEQLKRILMEKHFAFSDIEIIDSIPENSIDTILIFESPPLHFIVRDFLKYSINIYGEALLKNLGREFSGRKGNYGDGLKAVDSFLIVAGVENLFKVVDGSGLSRYNLSSPKGFVQLLLFDYSHFPIMPEILSSLPIGGYDGTLKKRQHSIEGAVRAKTGTMTGVSTLSGYLKTKKGKLLVFSIMANNYLGSSLKARELQDSILEYFYNRF